MAIKTSISSSFFLLLLLLLISILSQLKLGSPTADKNVHRVSVDSLLDEDHANCPLLNDSKSQKGNSLTLKLVNRFGPCSSKLAWPRTKPNFTELVLLDQDRVKWLYFKASPRDEEVELDQTSLPAYQGNPWHTLNYVVKIGIGTPRQDFDVIFDTGSDLTWLQCEPCSGLCHQQLGPKFNPSSSSTLRYSSCSSTECAELRLEGYSAGTCTARCGYNIHYADGSATVGDFVHDMLTLSGTDMVPDFAFECGQSNTGLFGNEGGLLGLGRRQLSLPSMAANQYGGTFSYCLPIGSSPGFLTFGSDLGSGSGSRSISYTPLLTSLQHPTFYYVSLVALSVGGQLLPVPPSVFSNSGTLLDSGTVITRLPSGIYAPFRTMFMKAMTMYPVTPSFSILDTCYDFGGHTTVLLPQIALHFQGGAKLGLIGNNIMIPLGGTRFCLAFAETAGTGIIGNWQQRTTEIVHDVAHSRIGFGRGACQ